MFSQFHGRENSTILRKWRAYVRSSDLTLARITGILERLGVPLLYLGDLFERPEIRDLLSLLAIDAEPGGAGLVRVAALPEYGISSEDVVAVLRWAESRKLPIINALQRVSEIDGLTESCRARLAKLGGHLDGFHPGTSPWTLLTTWLFERSDYLHPLLNASDTLSQQKLIAIYHLLKVCGEHASSGDSSRKRFLDRVRRIEALNEDTAYRAVASEAADMDAVRVMTIHGSKGLEFRAVHFPALATRYMPTNRQSARCPPPPSLAHLAMHSDHHKAEEECLFFVALSRARDYLCLSRAERYTTVNASASKFLAPIIPSVNQTRFTGRKIAPLSAPPLNPPALRDCYEERELTLYMQCPSRYRYERIDGLHGARDDSAYIRFHRCVYATIGWLEQRRQNGHPLDTASAQERLAAEWLSRGPVDHGFEQYYRSTAERMVAAMAGAIMTESGSYHREEWSVLVNSKQVRITPDRVICHPTGSIHVQRIRTGRKTKSEPDNPIYALLRRAARARYPDRPISVEIFYLATGETVPVPEKNDDKLIEQYATAIAGIEQGDFHINPDPRRCPNCPCYFMCGV